MRNINLFHYPNKLQLVFDKLNKFNIKSIIVGGYVRDFFLNISNIHKKDIDIELYGISSYDLLKDILKEFGDVNTVGKSFGVCKLSLEEIEIDFTFPRTDSKISSGHCGFLISINKSLDFKEASSRRDFTINSIGFDTTKKIFLDPFKGIQDIENKILRAVDIKKFAQDPLRVLRLVSFRSRFDFNVDKKLFILCQDICEKNILSELASERIYIEIKKVLLLSTKPSLGFSLLKDLNALKIFKELAILNEKQFTFISQSIDRFAKVKTNNRNIKILIMLSILCYYLTNKQIEKFITNLTNSQILVKKIITLLREDFKVDYNDSQLYFLSTRVNIENFLLFSQATKASIKTYLFDNLKAKAIQLNIFNKQAIPLIQGRDILALGITPSIHYKKILSKAYEAQMNLEINNQSEAQRWLKNYLIS